MSADAGASDFDVAKAISDLLKGIGKDRQERIVRWVAESIDVPLSLALGPERPPGPGAAPDSAAGLGSMQLPPGRAMDIKSFVETKNPKSDQQFAAVVAYFYRFEAPIDERRDSIGAEILQNAARLASRPRLAKPVITLNNAKNQGYLDTTERGQFRINSVGENLVAMTLPGTDTATKIARPRSSRGQTRKRATKQARSKESSRGHQKKAAPRRPNRKPR